jgi:FG-GAP-like repeat
MSSAALTRRVFPSGARIFAAAIALFACAPTALSQFAPPVGVDLGVGVTPNVLTGIASGDIDGDGFGDVLGVDNSIAGNIGVARGQVGGAYTAAILSGPLPATTAGMALPALGDFNLDGFLDVAMTGDIGGIPQVFVAIANIANPGAFTMPATTISLVLGGSITGNRITDVNNDGEVDILATVIGPNRRINTIPGAAGPTFGPITSSSTSVGPEDIDICVDIGGDGDKDLVVCGQDPSSGLPFVELLLGDNTGAFNAITRVQLPPQFTPLDVTWFDCDQDKDYDIVVACQSTGPASAIFRLTNFGVSPFIGPASLSPAIAVSGFPTSILRFESNFDGVEDLSVVSLGSPGASVVQNSFEVLTVLGCVAQSIGSTSVGTINGLAIAQNKLGIHNIDDQDHDGREDMLVVDQSTATDRVLVFRNVGQTDFTATPVRPMLGEVTPFTFRLNAPGALTGSPFHVLFSINGTVPGLPLPGGLELPLNPSFLPIMLSGTLGPGGIGILTTPPVAISTKPVGFSLQVACAAIVQSAVGSSKIVYASNPAVITMP